MTAHGIYRLDVSTGGVWGVRARCDALLMFENASTEICQRFQVKGNMPRLAHHMAMWRATWRSAQV